jgi:hypothetical protein
MRLSLIDSQHNNALHYSECGILFIVMLYVIMLNVVTLSIVMLSVIMLNVVMPNVVAPFLTLAIVSCFNYDF